VHVLGLKRNHGPADTVTGSSAANTPTPKLLPRRHGAIRERTPKNLDQRERTGSITWNKPETACRCRKKEERESRGTALRKRTALEDPKHLLEPLGRDAMLR